LAIVNNAVASLRKRHTTADDRRMLLEIINEEMARLDKLVSRLLNYARPVAAKHDRINLRELIVRTLALIEDRPGVTAELSFEGGVGDVNGDADLLRQAFENVVTNAVQAMRDQGTLRVAVSRHVIGGVPSIAIDFRDDGEGMDETACEQALSPFFTTRPTGTGLGLPIVGRVIEAHGGALSIQSTPGVGTTVRIALPEQPGRRLLAPAAGRAPISLLS
jgi:signal transduction histidine kinase